MPIFFLLIGSIHIWNVLTLLHSEGPKESMANTLLAILSAAPGEKVDEISPKFHQNLTEIPMEFRRKNTVKFDHNTSRFLCNITEILPQFH